MGIKIEDLTVTFRNKVTAVHHADLEIPKGIFGLLGENGAGKTTLMRVLTTVLTPTSGTVTLDGMFYSEGNFEKYAGRLDICPRRLTSIRTCPYRNVWNIWGIYPVSPDRHIENASNITLKRQGCLSIAEKR